MHHIPHQIPDQVRKFFKCVHFSKDHDTSQLPYRHPGRIPNLFFPLMPTRGAGTSKGDLSPKITGTISLKWVGSKNGKVFLYSQAGAITLLGFLCCQPGLQIWLKIFGPRLGGLRFITFMILVFYDALRTRVILMTCSSSRPCFASLDGRLDVQLFEFK